MRSAFLLERFMRSVTVGKRPSSIQHSSGCRMLPNKLRLERIWRISFGSLAMATPAIKSLRPERYLVAEYRLRSAPSIRGCWNVGPSSVLSTITSGLGLRCATRLGGVPDVGHHDGRIGRRLNQHDGQVLGRANGFVHLAGMPGLDGNAADTQSAEKILDQMLRAAVNGDRVDDVLAGPREREQRGHDGGHPGVEHQCRVRAGFKRHQTLFQNFGVGMIEARVNQVGLLAGVGLGASGHQIEGALGGFRAGEDVGGTAEHRGPRRSDRKAGIETAGENLCGRAEVLLIAHNVPPSFSVSITARV